MKGARATVSGSFHRHMHEVQHAVYALTDLGVDVLSPSDPRVVDAFGNFLFVASDRLRTVRLVQSRHLAAIDASDFLWLVCPDGYVGQSAAMELGWAAARRVPVLSVTPPQDLTMRQFVTVVPDLEAGVARLRRTDAPLERQVALLDPAAAVADGHAELERLGGLLLDTSGGHQENLPDVAEAARRVRRAVRGL